MASTLTQWRALRGREWTPLSESVCFVPSVSAVAIRDIDQQKDLYTNIYQLNPEESELDDFYCSSETTTHTAVTQELGQWLLSQISGRLPY
ncbi:hypothetical protein [Streptomyces reticuli]|uniref:hypothetical protein n=1 Tax=Streptomyces reticuli TaxID=1926 RepID=UPI00073E072B|nr:hypothetical protein TUE45_pSRTUE45b_0017 [Streptomyces reticuli]